MDRELLTSSYHEHLRELERSYAEVLTSTGYDAVVVHSGSARLRSEFDDQYWSLRVTPHFQHWLPLTAADSALVIAPGKRPRLIWYRDTSFWEKVAPPEEDFWQSGFELCPVTTKEAAQALLPSGRVAFIGEDRQLAAQWGFAEQNVLPRDLLARLDQLRTTKTPYEVLCLSEANRRAAVGHQALAEAFRTRAASEFDLHLLFLQATGQDDPETPYKNIVAIGENAATLHHITYRKTKPSGPGSQTLLVDAGASYLGYCSDITRTHVNVPGSGASAVASSFAALVASVERFQQQLCAEIKLGEKYELLHDRAHQHVAAALRDAGIVKLSEAEAVSSGITRAFFPHGLGHSLGLQCHDVGCALIKPRSDNPFLRNTTTIALGQCFTIEPGIYFIDSLLEKLRQSPLAAGIDWRLVDELAPLGGVRIEDDLFVAGGEPGAVGQNLTRAHLAL